MHARKIERMGPAFLCAGKLICRSEVIFAAVSCLLRPCLVCALDCVCACVCEYLHVQNISAAFTLQIDYRQSIDCWEFDSYTIHTYCLLP